MTPQGELMVFKTIIWTTDDVRPEMSFWGIVVYGVGTVIGMVGLFSVVHRTFWEITGVRIITGVFAAILMLTLAGFWTMVRYAHEASAGEAWAFACMWSVPLFLTVLVFYSDWSLAAVAGNYEGFPASGSKVVYWIYFVAKRLPMLQF